MFLLIDVREAQKSLCYKSSGTAAGGADDELFVSLKPRVDGVFTEVLWSLEEAHNEFLNRLISFTLYFNLKGEKLFL